MSWLSPIPRPWPLLFVLSACSGGELDNPASTPQSEADVPPATSDEPAEDAGVRQDLGSPVEADSGAAGPTDAGGASSDCACEHGPCVRREKESEPSCHPPCDNGRCAAGQACLQFPQGERCLPSGDRADGVFCVSPSECEGGLCIWSGDAAALCSSECSGLQDGSCGQGRSCLPSRIPEGSFHCYPTGTIPLGENCFQEPRGCADGYCIGAGRSQYCTRLCTPANPNTCPEGWGCVSMSPSEAGSMCCDPQQSPPGSCF